MRASFLLEYPKKYFGIVTTKKTLTRKNGSILINVPTIDHELIVMTLNKIQKIYCHLNKT